MVTWGYIYPNGIKSDFFVKCPYPMDIKKCEILIINT